MTHINNSLEIPDTDTYWPHASEQFLLNGSQDERHPHPDHYVYSDVSDYFDDLINNTFFYQDYGFEEIMYISFWTLLVIITASANVLIIAVFVRKRLRTPNNIILLLIAISDSLTGLVTLPTYLYVFTIFTHDIHSLNDRWCKAYFISTFYISKAFHAISIWQTLLLGFQRFCCIWFPFKTKSWFTTRRTLIEIAVITICAFVIQSYHLTQLKENKLLCKWNIEHPCVESCIFMWITLLLIHILPSGFLLVLTILIIHKLFNRPIRKEHISAEQSRGRDQQNKRASIIVVCIAIIVLIPEIPYGIFLLMTVIKRHSSNYMLDIEATRRFHIIYAMAMLLSFHANFWVYIIVNRRFRDELKSMFLDIKRKLQSKCTTDPFNDVSMEMGPTNLIALIM
ncbi:hypothetical protein ACJMK2_007574 [Sinanodonta woodiana]|uniref:G-protein coupled receptors family 1 profile domain-containing protein n=1 Tax=Sinanodonta woodiana TaxID=1069815 RepID=A0ABD3VIX9_SINWO